MSLFVSTLDSFIALKWVLPEPGSHEAHALQDAVRHNLHEIIAPDVYASEVPHFLTKAERKKIIPVGDAAIHLFDILQNGPTLLPSLPLLARAIELSSATRTGVAVVGLHPASAFLLNGQPQARTKPGDDPCGLPLIDGNDKLRWLVLAGRLRGPNPDESGYENIRRLRCKEGGNA